MSVGAAILAAAPWWVIAGAMAWRARQSRDVRDFPAEPPAEPPLISVVVPARNEEQNIERCARSVLASRWPRLELIIVDDHSSDRTGAIAASLARDDPRVRVITPAPLPDDWFGKQWACSAGARIARGELLCFVDADTWQAPDLLPRVVNAMRASDARAITVGGIQEMETFWERLVQAAMFSMLVGRFGGSEVINRSPRVEDKIANGQFILFRRDVYERLGGHAAVKGKVAEDLALAQLGFRRGMPIVVFTATDHFATRMYTSLREIVAGWSKNVWAGGIEAAPLGRLGRMLAPIGFLVPPLMGLAPVVALAGALIGVWPPLVALWALLAAIPILIWFAAIYHINRQRRAYALLYPLGQVVVLWIVARAMARGRNVVWKDRGYRVRDESVG